MSFHQINSIIIPSVQCLKIFMAKILRIEQNLWKARNFHPSKLICYMIVSSMGPIVSVVTSLGQQIKTSPRKADQPAKPGNATVHGVAISCKCDVHFSWFSNIQSHTSYSYTFNNIINLDVIYGYNLITRYISALYSYIRT